MNPEDQKVAQERIRFFVWSGFYKPDQIVEIICEEIFDPGTLNESWVQDQITQEFHRKRLDEGSWPTVTDCDRLAKAFAELGSLNIIALQNAGYTQSDGISDITEIWNEKGGPKSPVEGYCFFHGQDLERAVAGSGLMLTFGDIFGTDEKGVLIGKKVAEVFKHHGFLVDWDETIGRRINIPEIKWRKRS